MGDGGPVAAKPEWGAEVLNNNNNDNNDNNKRQNMGKVIPRWARLG